MSIQSIDTGKCIGCGACVAACPMDVLRMNDTTGKAAITYPDDCQICHLCRIYCPKQAIAVTPDKRVPVLVAWG